MHEALTKTRHRPETDWSPAGALFLSVSVFQNSKNEYQSHIDETLLIPLEIQLETTHSPMARRAPDPDHI